MIFEKTYEDESESGLARVTEMKALEIKIEKAQAMKKRKKLENSVRPAKGMTYKRVETPSGKVRAIPPAANSVQLAATPGVKRGK